MKPRPLQMLQRSAMTSDDVLTPYRQRISESWDN